MSATAATARHTENLIDADGIRLTFTIPARVVQIVSDLRSLMIDANADPTDFDALQAPGRLYGDLHTTLVNYLGNALDGRPMAARCVREALTDTYGGRSETEDALRHGLRTYGEHYGYVTSITWTD